MKHNRSGVTVALILALSAAGLGLQHQRERERADHTDALAEERSRAEQAAQRAVAEAQARRREQDAIAAKDAAAREEARRATQKEAARVELRKAYLDDADYPAVLAKAEAFKNLYGADREMEYLADSAARVLEGSVLRGNYGAVLSHPDNGSQRFAELRELARAKQEHSPPAPTVTAPSGDRGRLAQALAVIDRVHIEALACESQIRSAPDQLSSVTTCKNFAQSLLPAGEYPPAFDVLKDLSDSRDFIRDNIVEFRRARREIEEIRRCGEFAVEQLKIVNETSGSAAR